MENKYLEKMMEQLNSGEPKTTFRNISRIVLIGLTVSGRKAWQEEEEETRKDSSTVLILQEQLCISELFKVIPDAISRMCNQFTFHHQFRIDTGRTKFEQQTDSILPACGSHGQKS